MGVRMPMLASAAAFCILRTEAGGCRAVSGVGKQYGWGGGEGRPGVRAGVWAGPISLSALRLSSSSFSCACQHAQQPVTKRATCHASDSSSLFCHTCAAHECLQVQPAPGVHKSLNIVIAAPLSCSLLDGFELPATKDTGLPFLCASASVF